MNEIALVFGLMAAVAALATAASRLRIPYPVLLVLGGLALAFVPGLPRVALKPDVIFLLFLPPLLFAGAYGASWRDLRDNARAIGMLAIGLVLVTTVAVAVVAHLVAGLPWAAAFVLGAVVSPTDAIAATTIAQRLGVPSRIVTVLEGESLVNDATGIVAYRIAVGVAAGTVAFSPLAAGVQVLVGAVGGLLVGVVSGWLTIRVLRALDDAPVEAVVTLLAPFLAYVTAEQGPGFVWHGFLGLPGEPYFSGVLAAVVAGLYVGRNIPLAMSSASRLKLNALWDVLTFVLNGLAFILIGLQLPAITAGLGRYTPANLMLSATVVCLTVLLIRVLWVILASYVPHALFRGPRDLDPYPPLRNVAVVSWAGMRGVVSLAAALALPLTTGAGETFPGRDLILFLTFSVILATLVVQGLSLPLIIRRLGLTADGLAEREELSARVEAAQAALTRLGELESEVWVRAETAGRVREMYNNRRTRFLAQSQTPGPEADDEGRAWTVRALDYQRLIGELVQAQRAALLRMRDDNHISDEAFRRVQRDLDLEEAQLGG
ncbi:Na+/H+ antiporter [Deinococcus sp. Arct2-2]|uniref:Na+/H+ antiporter n=1 Tax=Deinococcus sp. Arct2-2 TaxID=2568653 RepID=UPI0010A3FD79|nr:Na+/H+ antiporter [Deinococcus sp. Arct2-2]THF68518.1 Na+/H+ antiporter [Deinococcus sp. Arct2-2]